VEDEPPQVSALGECMLTEWNIEGRNSSFRYQKGPFPACFWSFEAYTPANGRWAYTGSNGLSASALIPEPGQFDGIRLREFGEGEGPFATGRYCFSANDGVDTVDEGTFEFFEREEVFP